MLTYVHVNDYGKSQGCPQAEGGPSLAPREDILSTKDNNAFASGSFIS